MRQKYFDKINVKGEDAWRVKKQVSKLVTFAPFNLMNEQYEFKQKFHVIFCRNVLIYFDDETKNKVVDNLSKALEVGGYLILGHSESGDMRHPKLMPLSLAVFKKM
jgi:chemotaxis protein methyltransferase CheR